MRHYGAIAGGMAGARAPFSNVNGEGYLFRLTETNEPDTSARRARGAHRLVNQDIIDLYNRVRVVPRGRATDVRRSAGDRALMEELTPPYQIRRSRILRSKKHRATVVCRDPTALDAPERLQRNGKLSGQHRVSGSRWLGFLCFLVPSSSPRAAKPRKALTRSQGKAGIGTTATLVLGCRQNDDHALPASNAAHDDCDCPSSLMAEEFPLIRGPNYERTESQLLQNHRTPS